MAYQDEGRRAGQRNRPSGVAHDDDHFYTPEGPDNVTHANDADDLTPDELALLAARRSIAAAPAGHPRFAALESAAAGLAQAVRIGSLQRPDVVDALYAEAQATGVIDEVTEDAVLEAIGKGLDVVPLPINGHDDATQWEPSPYGDPVNTPDHSRAVLTLDGWIARNLPTPDFLSGSWMTTTSRAMVVAQTGLGKTNFAVALGMAIAAGAPFLHWQGCRPSRVLYIDGEMSRRLFRQRLADAVQRLGSRPAGFHALSHEDVEGFAPLNTQAGQQSIERIIEQIGGVDLCIFDSIMCLLGGDMKDGEPWAQTMPWVRSLTRRNIGQIWLHHTGHDTGRSYGDKTKEWQLDTVLHMDAIDNPETDVSFSLEFRKARERTPATRADFQLVRIALVNEEWQCNATATERPGRVPPLALKFLDALNNVLATGTTERIDGRQAASTEAWKAECVVRGLLDPAKPTSMRTMFNKYRAMLIGADRIACHGDLTWSI